MPGGEQEEKKTVDYNAVPEPVLPLYAHRGLSADYVENTPEAFAQAYLKGATQVEIDVWATTDGVLYVSHDNNLKRVYGKDLFISESTSKQVAGSQAANGQEIMTFQEMLDKFGDKLTYLVELKEGLKDVPLFVEVVKNNPELEKNIQVQGWDAKVLDAVEQDLPDMFKMQLLEDLAKLPAGLKSEAVNGISIKWDLMTPNVYKRIRNAGKKIVCWTVNDGKVSDHLFSMGVDGIISDSPKSIMNRYTSFLASQNK
ncbi:MAG: glycerophosphodiester phosphodiesterase [Erysipelotrichaceae bacterium]|nr:glycerophosphodiester phosphodiesterase [Erysipelotrichaceae bacterium]